MILDTANKAGFIDEVLTAERYEAIKPIVIKYCGHGFKTSDFLKALEKLSLIDHLLKDILFFRHNGHDSFLEKLIEQNKTKLLEEILIIAKNANILAEILTFKSVGFNLLQMAFKNIKIDAIEIILKIAAQEEVILTEIIKDTPLEIQQFFLSLTILNKGIEPSIKTVIVKTIINTAKKSNFLREVLESDQENQVTKYIYIKTLILDNNFALVKSILEEASEAGLFEDVLFDGDKLTNIEVAIANNSIESLGVMIELSKNLGLIPVIANRESSLKMGALIFAIMNKNYEATAIILEAISEKGILRDMPEFCVWMIKRQLYHDQHIHFL
jgi:hypothetical protein